MIGVLDEYAPNAVNIYIYTHGGQGRQKQIEEGKAAWRGW